MIRRSFVLFFLGLCLAAEATNVFRLCRVMPISQYQLKKLKILHNSGTSFTFLNKVQGETVPVFVIIDQLQLSTFKSLIKGMHSTCRPLGEDINPEMVAVNVADSKTNEKEYSFDEYHELNDTYSWLRSLIDKFPKHVSLITAGVSFEGRKILGTKISFGKGKKAIFIEGGSHGNEWISPAVVNYIIHQILTNKDLEFRSLIEKFDWYIVPHTNPDGYVFTHTTDRFWRKTVSRKNDTQLCFGADLNRNWGYHWNENNRPNDPCSNIYPGSEKFSEIESKSLSEYIQKIADKLILHLTIDGTNRWLFSPFGYANTQARNSNDLERLSNAVVEEVNLKFGIEYSTGPLSSVLYPISGTSMDWAYGELGVNYSFILQPPPNVRFGEFFEQPYLVSSSQIIPIGEEILYALTKMIENIINK